MRWKVRLVGIIIFLAIIWSIDISNVLKILSSLKINYFLAALALIVFIILLKAWRWQLFLKAQRIEYSLKDAFIVYFIGLFAGVITPGRMGDMVKVLYIKREGHSLSKSLISVLLDRGLDMMFLFIFGYLGMLVFFPFFEKYVYILTLLFLLFLVVLIKMDSLKEVTRRVLPSRFKNIELLEGLKFLNARNSLPAIAASLAAWSIYFLQMYLFALSLGINISFFYLAISVSISALITLLPISISGLGTRDVTMIILFSQVGIDRETAVAFSALIFINYLINGAIGFLGWLIKPIDINESS